MMPKPFTLLGRTALFLGLLMLVSQALWFAIAAYFFIRPVDRVYRQNFIMVVEQAKDIVERNHGVVEMGPDAYFRVVRDEDSPPDLMQTSGTFFPEIGEVLRQRLGGPVTILKQRDKSAVWIRFPAEGGHFWAVVSKGAPPLPAFMLASVGLAIAVAVAGSYAIIFNLTKRLRVLTRAVQAFGRGEPPPPVEEKGPHEIRDLSRGFNQMAADLQKLDEDRRIMLAGISHDLKTPLTRLRIALELVDANVEPELAAGMAHDIEDMDSILKQFLDYARDGAEERPVMADINVIAEDVCERYRAHGHRVEMVLGDLPLLPLRRLAIRRALTNLVENAVRHGRDDVRVETLADDQHVGIVVTDGGPGIKSGAPADYVKAFVRENTSRSEPGAGLGLTIVSRIIRTHGGTLHLENRATGGLLVRINLPRGTSDEDSGRSVPAGSVTKPVSVA